MRTAPAFMISSTLAHSLATLYAIPITPFKKPTMYFQTR
jgi:hypothetical protein